MARVYLATLRGAVGFEKRLVVKQIRTELASDEAFVVRFVEEAKTAVELSHPNIVPVYELGVEQGVYYIAMELCEGLTLSEVLAETGPLGPLEGAYVGAEICRALDYAHRRAGIVHRDVTPRNVLIDAEGAVRLIDFGIAAPVTRGRDSAHNEVFGSPGHMPPEQLQGAELTPASDVFAVGALLIEAWSGYPPFRRATPQESEQALLLVPPAIDREQPLLAPLSGLIARSVALDARERPAQAEHLARPLREFLKSEDSGDIARRLGERVRQARRRARATSPWLPGEGWTGKSENTPPVGGGAGAANASVGESAPATRTFAARQEVEVWTRRLTSSSPASVDAPVTPPMPGTRKLSRAPAALGSDDSRGEPSGISSSKIGRVPQRGAGWLVLATVLALAALAFSFVPRSRAKLNAGPPAASSSSAESARVRVSPEPTRSLLELRAGSPTPAPLASSHKSEESPRTHGLPANAPSAEPEQFGVLKITADPRALVEVSGPHFHQLGQSPIIGLKVPIGRYQIAFRNDTFGAPLNAQVMILTGVSRSVHADFRQAEPAVSVR